MTGALTLVLGLLAGTPSASVWGRVLEAGSDLPVRGAAVHLASAGYARLVFTDSAGTYAFGDVPAGRYRLDVTHPGFDPANVQLVVSGGLGLELEVPVTLRPIPTPPISIVVRRGARSAASDNDDSTAVETPSATLRWLAPGPQSASSLSEMAATRAAAHPPDRQGREGAHVLYIWGSSGEQGRVLLDGAALNAPLHLGGVLPPIDPELVELAEPRSGGASPRFDGGTTQVMEFVTRPARGDRARAWIEIDPLAGRAGFEAPVTRRGAVLAGARRVNAGLIERVTSRPFGYGYADALLRADGSLASAGDVSATLFATDESVTIPRDFTEDRATWTNLASSIRWWRENGTGGSDVTLSWSRAAAELPLLSAPAGRGESGLERLALHASRAWRRGSSQSAIGIEAERLGFERTERGEGAGTACATAGACFDETVGIVAPWGELTLQPRPRLRVGGGARLAYNARLDQLRALPRLSITALLGEATAIGASAGRYSRPTVIIPGTGPLLTGSLAGPSSLRAAVASATHVELSLSRRTLTSAAGATAFVRRHDGLPGLPAHTTPGVDVWWSRWDGASATTLAYSFARLSGGASTRDRHMLAASWSRAAGTLRLHVSSAWARGLPYVSFVLDDPEASVAALFDRTPGVAPGTAQPSGDYIRLDASVSANWTLNLPGGRASTIAPYVKVLNALARRDALFWFQDAGVGGAVRPLARMPLVPAVGVRWVF